MVEGCVKVVSARMVPGGAGGKSKSNPSDPACRPFFSANLNEKPGNFGKMSRVCLLSP